MSDQSEMNLVSKDFGGKSKKGDQHGLGRNEMKTSLVKKGRVDSHDPLNQERMVNC